MSDMTTVIAVTDHLRLMGEMRKEVQRETAAKMLKCAAMHIQGKNVEVRWDDELGWMNGPQQQWGRDDECALRFVLTWMNLAAVQKLIEEELRKPVRIAADVAGEIVREAIKKACEPEYGENDE